MLQKKTVLVMGLGRFGTALVGKLWESGSEVIVIDQDPTLVDGVKDRASSAFVGDATDPTVLASLVAQKPDVAVVTYGENFEDAVLCVASLKQHEVPEIIARAATDRMAGVLRAIGATRVLQLESEMGARLASEIVLPVARELIDLAGHYDVIPWSASGSLVGKTIAASGLRQRYSLNVLGIRKQGSKHATRLEPVAPDTVVATGDTLLLAGESLDLRRFLQDA